VSTIRNESQRDLITHLFQRIGPSETAMLDWLQPHIDDDILADIAQAD
jgi:hypothetical protein